MARQSRTMATASKTAELNLQTLPAAISRLKKRLDEVNHFTPSAINSSAEASEITGKLNALIDETLVRTFGNDTADYERYKNAAYISHSYVIGGTPLNVIQRGLESTKIRSASLLNAAIIALEERMEEASVAQSEDMANSSEQKYNIENRKIFIVHGHDDGTREAVARFLEKLGFEAIILHEQANRGKTIIEKFEANADVGFAIVLLTPDDIGGKTLDTAQPRARQNVILELGYFIGKLSRERVCALKSGDLEIPSDVLGVVYTDFDPAGAWRIALGKELDSAGYEFDWNNIMKY